MNYKTILLLSAASIFSFSGTARTILTPRAQADYEARRLAQPTIIPALDRDTSNLSAEEGEALTFLYAYMATPDALDRDSAFYLRNIRASLRADREMPWGSMVPDREWRHFVLPVRVNNENLDESRMAFYDELAPRLAGMTMTEAALEVNHWCHEKVTYQPSDGRTSSPLATVANALGRCGEESTFTVAALRSVGIPARQVYTPRWAHTDDNHAWVEVWTDGEWHFLGACEPEPLLDMAWFNEPAARGMLMNTTVTGAYDGPEEQLGHTPLNTRINVTSNYAPVRTLQVFVEDENGNPVEEAEVNFSLYNYAEYYPLAKKITDSNGRAELIAGRGDLLVWASDGRKFNLAKGGADNDTLTIRLDKDESFNGRLDFDLVPPKPGGRTPKPTPEQIANNDLRKAREDSIRLSYTSTFPTPEEAEAFCIANGYPASAATLLVKSRGNHRLIRQFLVSTPEAFKERAVSLLSVINEKDLHDITADVLADHLSADYGEALNSPLFARYILNPRIELEMLTPYKTTLSSLFTEVEKNEIRRNPRLLAERMARDFSLDSIYNPGRLRQSPAESWRNLTADGLNMPIAFVAACRSLGIPARIDAVSGGTQYADPDGNWQDVSFATAEKAAESPRKGELLILHRDEAGSRTPRYYSHFSISRLDNGLPRLLEFGDFEPADSINARHERLAEGQYALTSGQRLADGTVLARTEIFSILPDRRNDVALEVRQDKTALQVIGNLDAELTYRPLAEGSERTSILATTGRGYYVLGMVKPGHEPSAHSLNDIAAAADQLAATGRKILILFPDEASAAKFNPSEYGALPGNVVFGVDDGTIASALREGLELVDDQFPTFVVADSFNRIVLLRRGYTIGLGELLLDTLKRL